MGAMAATITDFNIESNALIPSETSLLKHKKVRFGSIFFLFLPKEHIYIARFKQVLKSVQIYQYPFIVSLIHGLSEYFHLVKKSDIFIFVRLFFGIQMRIQFHVMIDSNMWLSCNYSYKIFSTVRCRCSQNNSVQRSNLIKSHLQPKWLFIHNIIRYHLSVRT